MSNRINLNKFWVFPGCRIVDSHHLCAGHVYTMRASAATHTSGAAAHVSKAGELLDTHICTQSRTKQRYGGKNRQLSIPTSCGGGGQNVNRPLFIPNAERVTDEVNQLC